MQARINEKRLIPFAGTMIFTLVTIAGFAYVKWMPYYDKAFLAQSHHFIGDSILSGNSVSAPPVSWNAAVDYAIDYSKAIWKALLLGLILGSGIKVLLPTQWVSAAFRWFPSSSSHRYTQLSQNRHTGMDAGIQRHGR